MSEMKVYAEVGEDGGCMLFTLDPPGLLARGSSVEEAMNRAPEAARALDAFLAGCGRPYPGAGPNPEIVVAETVRRRGKVANGNTSAIFAADKVPVAAEEIPRFLRLQEHLRSELLELKGLIPEGAYAFRSLPHRMTIEKQLSHLASCDRWYLSRLWSGLPRLTKSKDVWDKLQMNRARLQDKMLTLTQDDLALIARKDGEEWTCRKFMRRAMYHERFHLDTIKRDLAIYIKG